MRILLLALWLCAFSNLAYSQVLSPEELEEAKIYNSLEEALVNPDEVYVLKLKVKNGEVPTELFTLTNLQSLEMRSGKITALPPEMANLKNLQKLDLSKNKLAGIPFVIFELTHLTHLHLGQNPITQVPDAISKLDELVVLDLWSTEVPRLPLSIKEMTSLQVIDLRMIEINDEEQDYWREYLPDVKIHFSQSCNCR